MKLTIKYFASVREKLLTRSLSAAFATGSLHAARAPPMHSIPIDPYRWP